MHHLFEELAHRYDLHTPAEHYQDDREFVLGIARTYGNDCALLDIGCGTGILVESACAAGIHASGIDAAEGMVRVAKERSAERRVERARMQDLDAKAAFDVVCALSWTLNYVANEAELHDVLRRILEALRPGGTFAAQIAHAGNATGDLYEDREAGPDGLPDDIVFLYRFSRAAGDAPQLLADYVYGCRSLGELTFETHELNVADAHLVASLAADAGFRDVHLYDSYRMDPFTDSAMPWLVAQKAP